MIYDLAARGAAQMPVRLASGFNDRWHSDLDLNQRATCSANRLAAAASYKIPAAILFLDALPRTSVGKLDAVALRHMLRAEPA